MSVKELYNQELEKMVAEFEEGGMSEQDARDAANEFDGLISDRVAQRIAGQADAAYERASQRMFNDL